MLDRLGLPRPQIATKFYGAIALTLVVVYVLAGAAAYFAGRTEDGLARIRDDVFAGVVRSASIESALERQRRLVAAQPFASNPDAIAADARLYAELGADIAEPLDGLGHRPTGELRSRFAGLSQQGASVFALAAARRPTEATAAADAYAAAAEALRLQIVEQRGKRARAAQEALAAIAASSRSLITWVCVAAAVSGLLIGPIGLLLLRRVVARVQGIAVALVRLARNDTSVDIPGLADQDEVGQLARSVAVFKTKSIELLQKKAEAERLNVQLDAAINNMPLGLSMFDAQDRLLVCNRQYSEMYELPDELTRAGAAHCAVWDHRTRMGGRHTASGTEMGVRGAGEAHPQSLTVEFGDQRIIAVSHLPLKGGGWLALHEDVTHRRRHEEEISRLARHDPLTNLGNRALFREQLQQALQRLGRGQGFAVLCLDLDRFKAVNDTLGHPIGDILLRQVSARLLHCVRHGDVVARLGGDEFAIIQAQVRAPDQTETLAARIVETISAPYEIEGHRVDISTSIGVTLAPRDGADADRLMKNADLALYRTKAQGRCGYSFYVPEMNDRVQIRRTFEGDLRRAVANEQLALCYQPLVCLETRIVTGFEALMRWKHPARGAVPPTEFIPMSEDIGVICELGDWALRHACAEAARWPAPVKVAVNLSPLQVKGNLIDTVLQALATSGLPPDRLELEITESVLLQDGQNVPAILHQLRQLGVRIALDDFGTGYSSLSYLRSFPFDKIKIDRAFVADIDRTDQARAIVGAIVRLGQQLGMTTVAEGIENVEQMQAARGMGCTEAQGFYFSPPVPPAEVARLLTETFEHARDAA